MKKSDTAEALQSIINEILLMRASKLAASYAKTAEESSTAGFIP